LALKLCELPQLSLCVDSRLGGSFKLAAMMPVTPLFYHLFSVSARLGRDFSLAFFYSVDFRIRLDPGRGGPSGSERFVSFSGPPGPPSSSGFSLNALLPGVFGPLFGHSTLLSDLPRSPLFFTEGHIQTLPSELQLDFPQCPSSPNFFFPATVVAPGLPPNSGDWLDVLPCRTDLFLDAVFLFKERGRPPQELFVHPPRSILSPYQLDFFFVFSTPFFESAQEKGPPSIKILFHTLHRQG